MKKNIIFVIAAIIVGFIADNIFGMGVPSESAAAPRPKMGLTKPSGNGSHNKKNSMNKRATPPRPDANQILPLSPVTEDPNSPDVPLGRSLKNSPQQGPQPTQKAAALLPNAISEDKPQAPHSADQMPIVYVCDDTSSQNSAINQPCSLKNHKTAQEGNGYKHVATGGAAAAVQFNSQMPVATPVLVREDNSASKITALSVPHLPVVASPSHQSSMQFATQFVNQNNNGDGGQISGNNQVGKIHRESMASGNKSSMVSAASAAVPVGQIIHNNHYQKQLFDTHQNMLFDRALKNMKVRYIRLIKQKEPAKKIQELAKNKYVRTSHESDKNVDSEAILSVYEDLFFIEYETLLSTYEKSFPDRVDELRKQKEAIWKEIVEKASPRCCVIL